MRFEDVAYPFPSVAVGEILAAHSGSIRERITSDFKEQARELREAYESKYGRAMTEEETEVLVRYLAGEALALGAFALARSQGSLKAGLDHVRAQYGHGLKPGSRPWRRTEDGTADQAAYVAFAAGLEE
jgi:hypothetical protein